VRSFRDPALLSAGGQPADSGDSHTPRVVTAVVAAGPQTREMIRRALAAAGVHVAEFYGDVQTAVAAVRREHAQLCLLDRGLPGAGPAAIAALTAHRSPPKVVVVGGSRTDERAARLAGAAAVLPGAVDAERLAETLAAVALP